MSTPTIISNRQGGVISLPKTITASTYTVLVSDFYLICNNVTGVVLTLPDAASFPGRPIQLRNAAVGVITSDSSNVAGLLSLTPGTAILGGTVGLTASLVSDGSIWYVMGL